MCLSARFLTVPFAFVALLLIGTNGLFAQQPSAPPPARPGLSRNSPSASLEIVVHTALGDKPLVGAQIIIQGMGLRALTDQFGVARVTGLPSGRRRIEVRYLGYGAAIQQVFFGAGRTTRVEARLQQQPIELAEVRVRGSQRLLAENGFFARRDEHHGVFFTREEIEDRQPRLLSDVVRDVPGVHITSLLNPLGPTSRLRAGSQSCMIQYFVDGILTQRFELDHMPPGDVEGMEIYHGSATVPAQFNRGFSGCGTIVIWTRYR